MLFRSILTSRKFSAKTKFALPSVDPSRSVADVRARRSRAALKAKIAAAKKAEAKAKALLKAKAAKAKALVKHPKKKSHSARA